MLQSAGGLILLVTGMQMVSGHGLPGPSPDADPETHWRTMAVVPIAIPLNVGGGAIAFIVAVSSANANTTDQLALSAICVGMAVLTGVVYVFAVPVAKRLGVTGMEVLTRLFGIVLVAIAFGVLSTGLKGLFPGLAA
jgi:multiple antibiotic resistance protein